ncbi:serine--tRNA ligase [Flavobacteriaceae bacterium UJ101]|nr:serine--tRNA ligase [Flavobacteriaceae bacterium UJ101]
MLQVNFIRENKEKVSNGLKLRNWENTDIIEKVIELDDHRKKNQFELENVLAESNKISKQIGVLYKQGNTEEANLLKAQTGSLKETTKKLQDSLKETKEQLNQLLYQIPNIPHELVKPGKSDEDNEIIFTVDSIQDLDESALPHWELAKKHDLIDFDLGAKITGAGFPVYTGKGARLQRALINYFLEKNTQAGYEEFFLPYMVNEASGLGTGQLPDKEGQMYEIGNSPDSQQLYVIPTGEVPMMNIFRNVMVNKKDLPIKATTHTPCFRREAGSYGAHVRGLNRLHQFEKVEIVQVTSPENSYQALDEMVKHVEDVIKELGLPYRILRLCGGDIGFTSAMTYDFEVYSAAQKRWLEVSSVSNCLDYQTNRLKLRFKDENGKSVLCHALNGSSLALPRIMAALLENYQTTDGIKIPEVLKPYTGFDKI